MEVKRVCNDSQGVVERTYLEGASSVQDAAEAHTTGVVYPLNHDADQQSNHQTAAFYQPKKQIIIVLVPKTLDLLRGT